MQVSAALTPNSAKMVINVHIVITRRMIKLLRQCNHLRDKAGEARNLVLALVQPVLRLLPIQVKVGRREKEKEREKSSLSAASNLKRQIVVMLKRLEENAHIPICLKRR